SGNMERLAEKDLDDRFFEEGRLAFYAKGKVLGSWLLTMSYDSAKASRDKNPKMFQGIDPNTYYTVYGDGSQQGYDAERAGKLYLRVERENFFAMYGDYETGLTTTELSRYSRRLTGMKTEYREGRIEATAFASETGQTFGKDELRGDGTSGLYRLTGKDILLNSEKITIEVRDRVRTEIVLSTRVLARHMDYTIDYEAGTVWFKEPIPARDDSFNPVFIIAEYEVRPGKGGAFTVGARGAVAVTDTLKTGVTLIQEHGVGTGGRLIGTDVVWKPGPKTEVRAEVAFSENDSNPTGVNRRGSAEILQIEHRDDRFSGRLYYREMGEGFGLGQQRGTETATRKIGGDGQYRLSEQLSVAGLATYAVGLDKGGERELAEAKLQYQQGPVKTRLGLRQVLDRLPLEGTQSSTQITAGASWETLGKRLTLLADHDQSVAGNSNVSFPTRTTFGADYKLTDATVLMGREELVFGQDGRSATTKLGLKTTPWKGATLTTGVQQALNEQGTRVGSLLGLQQKWMLSQSLAVDAALDRTDVISESTRGRFHPAAPSPSGDGEAFTAVSLGATFVEAKRSWNARLEYRTSDQEDKWGMVAGYLAEPAQGWAWTARLQLFDSNGTSSSRLSADTRLGLAYRPAVSSLLLLDRLDLIYENQSGSSERESRRFVNVAAANYRPSPRLQLFLQYGSKYVLETVGDDRISGYTDLLATEARYDLTPKWDVGLRGSALHSWSTGTLSYGTGISLGHSFAPNTWISIGYNFTGFHDRDFSSAEYTAAGPFIKLRMKFDQNSVQDALKSFGAN
ncbi:MAG TPA: hypothetical protein VNX25_05850, partial [Verrucomicrobiae bacterium]|nr:hypothetical protein [Verrucomicrobiae bacterium]